MPHTRFLSLNTQFRPMRARALSLSLSLSLSIFLSLSLSRCMQWSIRFITYPSRILLSYCTTYTSSSPLHSQPPYDGFASTLPADSNLTIIYPTQTLPKPY